MKLALFFTTSISLQVWEKNGVLSREIKPYIELSHFLEKIYFITYGGVEDLKYQKFLPPNIRILPNKWNVPHKL
jgi:hypothetical protein